jgi:LysM repeat protein
MTQSGDDPVQELLALLASRQPQPELRDEPGWGVLTGLAEHPLFRAIRIPSEFRAALAGVIVALMFILFIVIRLDPAGGSGGPDLTAVSAKSIPTFWVVRSGQTMAQIAAQTGLSVTALEDLNPYVDPGTLQVGEQLRLRATKSTPSGGPDASTAALPAFWVIKSGQTFSLIAARTGLSIPQIEALNPKLNPGNLQIGDRVALRAAPRKPAVAGASAAAARSAAAG